MYSPLANVAPRGEVVCGVYAISNTLNGKIYIGSSKNVLKRAQQHYNKLKQGKHFNSFLQRAFDKDGESAFVFEILVSCMPEERVPYENIFLAKREKLGREWFYNIANHAEAPYERHLSLETRHKISKSLLQGIDRQQRAEQARRIWQNPISREKRVTAIREAIKHRPPLTEEQRRERSQKIHETLRRRYPNGRVPWNKGKKTPLDVRQKQSRARLGKTLANKGKKLNKETNHYE